MKELFLSRAAKACIDVLLIMSVVMMLNCHPPVYPNNYWQTPHCLAGIASFFVMILHVWQHWPFIKVLIKKRVMLKNKMTALTTLCFMLMAVSILLFMVSFTPLFLRYHNIVGHLFGIIVIIHLIQKFKRFIKIMTSLKVVKNETREKKDKKVSL